MCCVIHIPDEVGGKSNMGAWNWAIFMSYTPRIKHPLPNSFGRDVRPSMLMTGVRLESVQYSSDVKVHILTKLLHIRAYFTIYGI
jgi:hypothetical protein